MPAKWAKALYAACSLRGAKKVIIASRSASKLAELRRRLGDRATNRLVSYTANLSIIADAHAVLESIQRDHGQVHAVIASLGGWWQGTPLHEIPLGTWYTLLDNNLTSHLIVARSFLPLIGHIAGSSYTFINGGAADTPIAEAGPMSILSQAQLMMKDVLVQEWAQQPVRINTLLLATPILTRSRPHGPDHWLTADEVGAFTAYLVSDRAADVHGQNDSASGPASRCVRFGK
ncbi:MAG: SDR family oxidoreductase [Blastochloris sp.]|nr:SDR family oxidoreductase [Blastochloris sp.]